MKDEWSRSASRVANDDEARCLALGRHREVETSGEGGRARVRGHDGARDDDGERRDE